MAAPSTSGTVGQTVILVNDLIERAAMRCSFVQGEIDEEMLDIGRQNLFVLLSALANQGVTLWTQQKTLLGTVPGQLAYPLPAGVVDIKNALYRQPVLPAGGSAFSSAGAAANAFSFQPPFTACDAGVNGNIGYNFGSAVTVVEVGIMPAAAATLNLVWEYQAADGSWVTFYAPGSADYAANVVTWADVDPGAQATQFRVRETGGADLSAFAVVFDTGPTDLPMSRMNRDDYTAFPDKTAQGTLALQYFVERLQNYPQMRVWQVPQTYFNAFLVWNFRHIQDVGTLTNIIEVPQRWLAAITAKLALALADEYPAKVAKIPGLIDRLEKREMRETLLVQGEERDDSPEYIAPVIGGYTA